MRTFNPMDDLVEAEDNTSEDAESSGEFSDDTNSEEEMEASDVSEDEENSENEMESEDEMDGEGDEGSTHSDEEADDESSSEETESVEDALPNIQTDDEELCVICQFPLNDPEKLIATPICTTPGCTHKFHFEECLKPYRYVKCRNPPDPRAQPGKTCPLCHRGFDLIMIQGEGPYQPSPSEDDSDEIAEPEIITISDEEFEPEIIDIASSESEDDAAPVIVSVQSSLPDENNDVVSPPNEASSPNGNLEQSSEAFDPTPPDDNHEEASQGSEPNHALGQNVEIPPHITPGPSLGSNDQLSIPFEQSQQMPEERAPVEAASAIQDTTNNNRRRLSRTQRRRRHLRNQSTRPIANCYRCDLCPRTFNNTAAKSLHMRSHLPANTWALCQTCGFSRSRTDSVLRHCKSHNHVFVSPGARSSSL